ncbi:MAG: hypothetical protein Q9209_007126 [Squamulea sp. 1 TL-2023]
MDWSKWSGFEGEGIYTIFNSASQLCLSQFGHDGNVQVSAHCPHDMAQQWRIHSLDTVHAKVLEHNASFETNIAGFPCQLPISALWAIDTSMCALEKGKMVIFRSILYPGRVMGQDDTDEKMVLCQEVQFRAGRKSKLHKWLLQKQPQTDLKHTANLSGALVTNKDCSTPTAAVAAKDPGDPSTDMVIAKLSLSVQKLASSIETIKAQLSDFHEKLLANGSRMDESKAQLPEHMKLMKSAHRTEEENTSSEAENDMKTPSTDGHY